jgi:hypothetical protein
MKLTIIPSSNPDRPWVLVPTHTISKSIPLAELTDEGAKIVSEAIYNGEKIGFLNGPPDWNRIDKVRRYNKLNIKDVFPKYVIVQGDPNKYSKPVWYVEQITGKGPKYRLINCDSEARCRQYLDNLGKACWTVRYF